MNNLAVSKCALLMACVALLSSPALLMAQAGSLDTTFGNGGIVTTPNSSTACGAGAPFINCTVAIQSNGKIVVAGSDVPPPQNTKLALARYNPDGSLDSTFGSGGVVHVSENNGGPIFGLASQTDGKIVAAAPFDFVLAVFRYNTNGTLDSSFGSGGMASISAVTLVGPAPGGLVLLPSGKILVAAGRSLVQLLPSGQLDSSFGSGGVAPLLEPYNLTEGCDCSAALALAVPFGGQPLVLSSLTFTSATQYYPNGSLNTAFGVNGQAPSLGPAAAILPLGNGNLGSTKFLVAGTLPSAVAPAGGNTPQAFVLTRYNSNGTIDTTFGSNGAVVTNFPGFNYSAGLAMAVQSNGDILAAGITQNETFGSASDFALARYNPNGQLDTTFGNNGLVTTAFGTNGEDFASASALAIQSDGKIVAVGGNLSPTLGSVNGFTLARYLSH